MQCQYLWLVSTNNLGQVSKRYTWVFFIYFMWRWFSRFMGCQYLWSRNSYCQVIVTPFVSMENLMRIYFSTFSLFASIKENRTKENCLWSMENSILIKKNGKLHWKYELFLEVFSNKSFWKTTLSFLLYVKIYK